MACEPPAERPASRTAEAILDRHFGHRRDIRIAGRIAPAADAHLPTGFAALDRVLPGNGWPLGAITEILDHDPGSLWILLPALCRLDAASIITMISPPLLPYAPALEQHGLDPARILLVETGDESDALWAAEEALRAAAGGGVLFWLRRPGGRVLKRLQLAAVEGNALGVCFRPARHAGQRSTAAVRLLLRPRMDGVDIDLIKARGGRPQSGIVLSRDDLDR